MRDIRIVIALISLFSVTSLYSQQESQFTQYMYNTMMYNPAYTGSRGVGSFFGVFRAQWLGIDGAPRSGGISYHAPQERLRNVGLGYSLYYDQIGPQSNTSLLIDFSYTLNFDNSKLAFGLKGTGELFSLDYNKLRLYDQNDKSFEGESTVFSPNIGAGVFWYTDNYYLGFSVPNLLETEIYESKNKTISVLKNTQHYYFLGGYVFDLSLNTKFKPALLAKMSYGAPIQLDVSANFMFNEKFVLGAAWRYSAAVSLMAGFQINDLWFIGYGYDYETTELSKYNSGSHEIFMRYELVKVYRKVVSPRFF